MVKVQEYGSWESPLKSLQACDSSISLVRMYFDRNDGGRLFWDELRPSEEGRSILFSKPVDADLDTPPTRWTNDIKMNVYDMVHEYGGAPYFVHNGTAYFSNLGDNHIYKQTGPDQPPVQVTKTTSDFRYADGEFSRAENFFFVIREDHRQETIDRDGEVQNLIVAVNTNTGAETIVASGNNFYSTPRVSPDGKKLVWVTWVHNNMPWDSTEIWTTEFTISGDNITVGAKKKIAGQDGSGVSFMEPRWTSDGKLLFICDQEKWWNLYIVEDVNNPSMKCVKQDLKNELGQPCWDFGYNSFSPNPHNADEVAVLYGGRAKLLSISSGEYTSEFELREDQHVSFCLFCPDGNHLFLQVVCPKEPAKIIKCNKHSKGHQMADFHHSAPNIVADAYLSIPEPITFAVEPGEGSDVKEAYGYYYPPKNDDFEPLPGTKPPVLLKIHGGPTGSASLEMDLQKQYFTSRGIAIFDLNYRGSTGYGSAFRNELKLKWGVYDIADSLTGALALVDLGKADRDKLLISGGSSGGYTTLACLTFDENHPKVFAAGASYYGISNLEVLAEETHKFESHYTETMIGEFQTEEGKQVYKDRSPWYNIEKFSAPCAFFQGALDKVVPPDQSRTMHKALVDQGLPCAYVEFEDEEHGFKISANKQKALDGEFYFYSIMLGFQAFDEGIEITIDNPPDEVKQAKKKQKKN